LRKRRAKNDQIGGFNGGFNIFGDDIRNSQAIAKPKSGIAADEGKNLRGELALSRGQGNGATQQTRSDNTDIVPTHRLNAHKLLVGRWNV
jgi:hypothetical protein